MERKEVVEDQKQMKTDEGMQIDLLGAVASAVVEVEKVAVEVMTTKKGGMWRWNIQDRMDEDAMKA